jgi:hypothetical protein
MAFAARLRVLAVVPSRRTIVRTVGGLLLAGPIAALRGVTTTEGKKKRKKKCKPKCGSCATCKKGKCKPKAAGIACEGGGLCLANATCATTCEVAEQNCPAGCKCFLVPSVEGPHR